MGVGGAPLKLVVPEDASGERIDKFLSEKLKDRALSRTFIQHLIENGFVLLNSKTAKRSARISQNDIITVNIPEKEEFKLVPEMVKLDIIYEDDSVIVLSKPSGVVVHPSPGHTTGSLVNALIGYTDKLSSVGGPLRPGIVHRLDKETSGVMVIARDNFSHYNLTEQFTNRVVKKIYKCIVVGRIGEKGRIEKIIGRSEHDRKRFSTRTRTGKPSFTEWRRIANFENFSLLEVIPITGRTHQIRVHLSDLGSPILGDRVYGGKVALRFPDGVDRDRLYLHAERIGFIHPRSGKFMEFSSPLPDYFVKALKILESLHG